MEIPVVSYARFSSQNQREASIEIQQEHINRFCKENRFRIIKEYVDRAQSATTDNRPQFQQMIADAASRCFKAVIVYNSSRFCRNIQDHLKYRAILESYGVRILSVQEDFDQSTPEGGLLSNFMMSINEYFSKDLSRKIYLGCLESAKKGLHVGGPAPFGFTITDDKKFAINEKEAEIVRIIFEKVDEGMSYRDLAKYLNEHGYRRRDGSCFSHNFYDLLSNRKYMGEYVWNRTKNRDAFGNNVSRLYKDEDEVVRIPDGMPKIVDEELFNRVQEIINKRKDYKFRTTGKGRYLLSSLVICGHCGFKMSGEMDTNGNGRRTFTRILYRCDTQRKRHVSCTVKPINALRLENYITNLVNSILLNTKCAKKFSRVIKQRLGNEHEELSEKRNKLANDAVEIQSSIDNLIGALSSAKNVAYQEILKNIEILSNRKTKTEENIQKIDEQLMLKPLVHEEIISRKMIKYRKAIVGNDIDSLKKLLRMVITEIKVDKENVYVTINLNAYLTSMMDSTLTMTIIESRSNIEILENQSKLALTWPMLKIEYL